MKHPLAGSPKFGNYRLQLNRDFSLHKRNYILKRSLTLIALVLVLLPATVRAQQSATIHWELVNPFRFIHDQETIDQLRAVYDALPVDKKTAAALERKLQDIADAEVTQIRETAAAKYECQKTPQPVEVRRQCFEPYAGWFARLAKDNHLRTCWDSERRSFRNTGRCKNYLYPTTHRVRVWVTNPEAFGNNIPAWTVQPAMEAKPCDVKHKEPICLEFDVPYPQQSLVVAKFPGLPPKQITIKVEDRLIVGLGDSFAAGEGNPDIPAQFIDSDRNRDKDDLTARFTGNKEADFPKKDTFTEAAWLDLRCHRSMYSYQFKTALQLALSNPKEAITYVSFSCSGAVTKEIIKESQEANERGSNLKPQLKALREVLENDKKPTREIDFLLLSTGGNDIGFAKYVTYIVLGHKWLIRFAKSVSAKRIERSFKNNEIEKKLWGTEKHRGNYRLLHDALGKAASTEPSRRIRIKGCEPDKKCERILLTPYPDVFTDENGSMCQGNRNEFKDSFGEDIGRPKKIELVRQKVFEELQKLQAHPGIGTELGWTVVARNVPLYFEHGFCAQDDTSTSIGEIFRIPKWEDKKWTVFNPRDYRAYESRERWLRLPVDSKLVTDEQRDTLFGRIDIFFRDVSSNLMHPTAEGLAHTADLNVKEIQSLQKKTLVPQF